MATYLVERYWPGVDPAAAQVETDRLLAAGVRIVETIVASSDEVCYWYVAGTSARDVEVAFASVGVAIDRVADASTLPRS